MVLKSMRMKRQSAFSISKMKLSPAVKLKYHRKEAIKSFNANDVTGYSYHTKQIAKIRANSLMGKKGQMNLGTLILIAIVFGGFLLFLSALNTFVGGSNVNLFQYWGTPALWGIGTIAIAGIIGFFVNEQFDIFHKA